ncbi:PREDICTED: LOW QUALITY PROTEIN: protein DGCR14 [Bison bison bison]|uniref:LOW QUALITY PROTEIN: protein DGCR14 n=1 Tax=Bison bison bison TaxID=43346 RepID=A0A6P3HEJ8_BISBB|nr:PREDICTED: LOW QUALITY PROTEIN: protein DGCR14 [Bison bison bison]
MSGCASCHRPTAATSEGLQTVIQRDFFPDVEKLQAQKEYLEAEENGDLERMRQIAIKFGSALGKTSREPPPPYVTPATFETPELHMGPSVVGGKARARGRGLEDGDGEAAEEAAAEPLPSLDVFLSRHTSEDNASFREIMEVAKERGRARHAWLYQAEEEFEKRQKDSLALPSAEHQAVESGQAGVETWKYKAKNSLMYYPEAVIRLDPSSPAGSSAWDAATAEQSLGHHCVSQGVKARPRGQRVRTQPNAGGQGAPEPSPRGRVATGAAGSLILEPGRRERLGLKMANEAAAKNRAKKQEALRRVTENLASLTPKGLSPAMSPALQRLVSRTASKYTDRALRASYTRPPARASHLKTPAHAGLQTPTEHTGPRLGDTTPLSQDPACITDNLLQLPARRKASDFF